MLDTVIPMIFHMFEIHENKEKESDFAFCNDPYQALYNTDREQSSEFCANTTSWD